MVTGSVASSLLGEPRATHDIDIVVALRSAAVDDIVEAFPEPDFFVSADAAREAVATRGMFNLLDTTHGDKVDFWLLTDEPFDRSRFVRRQSTNILGTTVWVSTPEDTVLAKLRWAEMSGGSEKQFVDALRVYEVQFALLDQGYLDEWAEALDVSTLLHRLRNEAQPLVD